MKMKSIIVLMLMTCAIDSAIAAKKKNPDKYPSLEVIIERFDVDGDVVEQDGPSHLRRYNYGSRSIKNEAFGFDLIVPIHYAISLTGAYRREIIKDNFNRENGIYIRSDALNGDRYRFGIKLYFPTK